MPIGWLCAVIALHGGPSLGGGEMRKKRLLVTLLLLSACGLPAGEARSQSPQFYKDKQITLIAGAPVGGSYDTYARLVARHLGEHVPGKPAVIVQNMPGAVSIRAANHL